MKRLTILFVLILFNCTETKNSKGEEELYFFFDAQNKRMIKPETNLDNQNKFLYTLNKRNALFKSDSKKKEIYPEDTIKINLKNINWLESLTIKQYDSFFYKPMKNKIYIVEKDYVNNKLYKYEVLRTLEID